MKKKFYKLKKVYIGLTYNFNSRKISHQNNSHNPNIKKLIESNENYEINQLTKYLDSKEAQLQEKKLLTIIYHLAIQVLI